MVNIKGNKYSIPVMIFFQEQFPELFKCKLIPKIKISLGIHNYIYAVNSDAFSSSSLYIALGFGIGCIYELSDKTFIDWNLNLTGTSGLETSSFLSRINLFLVPSIGICFKF